MDLRRRVDQVIKDKEAAVVWTEEEGFRLIAPYYENEDRVLPEELVAFMLFIERFCADDEWAESLLEEWTGV